ncbi:hypothetical protein [Oricola thermophila]|uniref:Uncharacterized protein n=1 Tax=Oricola thermophila TaxID=2742145 RepID=A0A6N1VDD1_9HYPH|nr:hypothetical protein [Oricola thermophila]QKV18910.1 hypothetical protein HTY61_10840 [Oricola thermophila]
MEFDWKRAVERNLDDLLRIVAHLFFMAGIRTGRSLVFLPRGLRTRILSVLRPAEFAARRLIVMAACKLDLDVKIPPERGERPDGNGGDHPATAPGDGTDREPGAEPSDAELLDLYRDRPSFQLFDPWKRHAPFLFDVTGLDGPFGHVLLEYDEEDGGDWPGPDRDPDELVDARALSRRIRALALALDDLDGQAARLARWKARFDRAIERMQLADAGRIDGVTPDAVRKPAPWRFRPLRPGLPPGWRRRPRNEVEEVLKECHLLALDAWNTS